VQSASFQPRRIGSVDEPRQLFSRCVVRQKSGIHAIAMVARMRLGVRQRPAFLESRIDRKDNRQLSGRCVVDCSVERRSRTRRGCPSALHSGTDRAAPILTLPTSPGGRRRGERIDIPFHGLLLPARDAETRRLTKVLEIKLSCDLLCRFRCNGTTFRTSIRVARWFWRFRISSWT